MKLLRACATGGLVLAVLAPTSAQSHDDAIQLSWDEGGPYSATFTVPVFPDPRVVPGDSASRSFVVRNDGPGSGVLTAQVVDVELAGDPRDEFYSDFLLNGEAVRTFHGHDTLILTRTLEPGQMTTIDLDYAFPWEATSGNYPEEGTVQVDFDLELRIEGELPPPGTDTPPPATATPPDTDTPSPGTTTPGLPQTGGPVLGAALGAFAALVIGAALVTRRRSRT